MEEGASGFLQKKLSVDGTRETVTENSEVDWCSVNKFFSEGVPKDCGSFGSKHWASVYLASTPQQAAEMGLKFPGVNEVRIYLFILQYFSLLTLHHKLDNFSIERKNYLTSCCVYC